MDVALILDPVEDTFSGRDLNIIVVNDGARTAYDVEVVVNIRYPENSSFFSSVSDAPIGSASIGSDGYSIHWTIPALGGLQRGEVAAAVTDKHSVRGFDKSEYVHEYDGKATTSSFESNLHQENNEDRAWSVAVNPGDDDNEPAWSTYSVNVSVDVQHPSPGDIVNFTITANHGGRVAVIDQKVAIELTDGLVVDEDANVDPPREISYAPDDRADSVSYSSGVFNIGTLTFSDYNGSHSVTLPVRVSSNAVVNEQCLTATITGNPPPGTGPREDDISDNVAQLCLGEQPVEPFVNGQVHAFTVYPCVGITTPPCDSMDDVRVRAVDSIGRVLAPGTALFHVDSLTARKYDAKTGHSVNDGNTVSWQTAVSAGSSYTGGLDSGVELYYSRTPFQGHESDWKRPIYGISARDAKGNIPPPGKVFLRSTSSGNELRKAESPNYQEVPTSLSTSAVTAVTFHYFLEFEKMGIYEIEWHVKVPLNSLNGSEDCLPDGSDINQAFCASETYAFVVGPMADLTVEDGGASSRVAADQNAVAMVAVNNGPDSAGSAQVTGLPTGAEVIHISRGAYDSATGEWNIGELKVSGYYRSRGEPEPTLVLSAADGDTADREHCQLGKLRGLRRPHE